MGFGVANRSLPCGCEAGGAFEQQVHGAVVDLQQPCLGLAGLLLQCCDRDPQVLVFLAQRFQFGI